MPTDSQLDYARKLAVCVGCDLHRRAGDTLVCGRDAANIQDHAGQTGCPAGRYPGAVGSAVSGTRTERSGGIVRSVIHGAIGVAKAVTASEPVALKVIAEREAVCDACEHATKHAATIRLCSVCGCAIWAKVRVASEACPVGRWMEVSTGD